MMNILILIPKKSRERLLTQDGLQELTSLGKLTCVDGPETLSQEALADLITDHTILITGWQTPRLPVAILEKTSQKLEYICHLTGSIKKIIPQEIVTNPGITVTNWGTTISGFVAETALTLLLACSRRLRYRFDVMVNQGGWQGDIAHGSSLFYKHIGLYGFGAIARELVKLLAPFEMTISFYDPYVTDNFPANLKRCESLDELFQNNDIISIHAGQTAETKHTVDRRRLEMLPLDAILVNTARGDIINEEELIQVLQEKPLRVGLDVYEHEPLVKNSYLRESEQVVLTPHLGGKVGDDHREAITRTCLNNIRNFIEGHPLQFVVTEEHYQRMT